MLSHPITVGIIILVKTGVSEHLHLHLHLHQQNFIISHLKCSHQDVKTWWQLGSLCSSFCVKALLVRSGAWHWQPANVPHIRIMHVFRFLANFLCFFFVIQCQIKEIINVKLWLACYLFKLKKKKKNRKKSTQYFKLILIALERGLG